MSAFRCKMCGAPLPVEGSIRIATCEYCGAQQTIPMLSGEKKANLYDRANHFRRSNEFDKAMAIYEHILEEDGTDPEAYWSLVLCRYGVEYVEDPTSGKRIPTVNRVQYTSVFDDDNYRSAVKYAELECRQLYEQEAKAINDIQKRYLEISQKEKPFDVFICYKETDERGRRTVDSAIANDIYHQLTQEGLKVFYAAITLEDKLGQAYEPYIFAALHSAKVMLVVGTKPQHFNAVWVKNEWSRFLNLTKTDRSKLLIPCYRDMDAYDLPEEFSHLQAQDMSKIGFVSDVVRGIKKVTMVAPKQTAITEIVTMDAANVAPLLKRAFMALEDGEWERADQFCEQVLNVDPECAEAYLVKLLIDLRIRHREQLKEQAVLFDNHPQYKKIQRFADEKLKAEISEYLAQIENRRLENTYQEAKKRMSVATNEMAYRGVEKLFREIAIYKDAAEMAELCSEKAEDARKDDVLKQAKIMTMWSDISKLSESINLLRTISGWKDADQKIQEYQMRVEVLLQEQKEIEKRRKIAERIVFALVIIAIAAIVFARVTGSI